GLLGHKSGYQAMQEADVLVMLGTDFPYVDFLPQDSTIVQIDWKANRLGRRVNVDLGLAGDIGDTLKALLSKLKQKENDEFLKKSQNTFKQVEKDFDAYVESKGEEDAIHPEYVACAIDGLADDNAIFTVDTGMSAVWAARFLKGGNGRYLTGSLDRK